VVALPNCERRDPALVTNALPSDGRFHSRIQASSAAAFDAGSNDPAIAEKIVFLEHKEHPMRRAVITTVLAIIGLAIWSFERAARGCGDPAVMLEAMAKNAVSEDTKLAEQAIKLLRRFGPEGLKALLAAHADAIKKHTDQQTIAASLDRPKNSDDPDEKAWLRLRAALDEVSGQRDCHASRLFWYTDLDLAKAAAKREGKPILSLRLLGKLTDEYSCANSRFFRTTLYSNAEIGKALGERFILHWKSVRPVPKVTIDFGDGRKLERTLTGNSIHYVLDGDGQIIDALPGLYGPKAFLRELERAEQATKNETALSPSERSEFLVAYHRERATAITAAWQADLNKLGITAATNAANPQSLVERPAYVATAAQTQPVKVAPVAAVKKVPNAATAGATAIGKYQVEMPIIRAAALASDASLAQATTDEVWNRIAQLHAEDSKLDAASFNLIRSQHPTAAVAARRAMSKMVVEDPLVRMVRMLQGSIALDTVRNEYTFHRQIHQWLAAGNVAELDSFNERVYAELFLTPSSDPWLGLMPADAYTALEDNGVKQVAKSGE
jgi:hypothetical protein